MPSTFDADIFLSHAPTRPGVYCMYDTQQTLIYVGKAKHLKKRLQSYFRKSGLSIKTQALVDKIAAIEVTITHTETEALLLEQTLIKAHHPRYNILLRDDKTYPYIIKDNKHGFEYFKFFRSLKRPEHSYGPFPSTQAVRQTLQLIYKIFRLRQCDNTTFAHRSRPCLQHQIGRCSAPCVGLIDLDDYQKDVRHAELFLRGEEEAVANSLMALMQDYAQQEAYEKAARLRDQIQAIRYIQSEQFVSSDKGDADIFALAQVVDNYCVCVLCIRKGQMLASENYFPDSIHNHENHVLLEFVAQYYLGNANKIMPKVIVVPHDKVDGELLATAIQQAYDVHVKLMQPQRGDEKGWYKLAQTNATQSLSRHLANKKSLTTSFAALQRALALDSLPVRLECFDISHTQGKETVASCVVFNHEGPMKKNYRRFNISGITPGDDYAAMRQVLTRRYSKQMETDASMPSIVLIDGGKGQLSMAVESFKSMGMSIEPLWGIAKGEGRKAGLEILHHPLRDEPLDLPADSPALHLLQYIRDEAHRFAITGHRKQRGKKISTSPLEGIEGVGAKKRQALLKYFGGWQALATASEKDLAKVPGIGAHLAQLIYQAVHE